MTWHGSSAFDAMLAQILAIAALEQQSGGHRTARVHAIVSCAQPFVRTRRGSLRHVPRVNCVDRAGGLATTEDQQDQYTTRPNSNWGQHDNAESSGYSL